MKTIHLGLDDTDSNEGMCTTYLITLILERIKPNILNNKQNNDLEIKNKKSVEMIETTHL